MLNYVKPIMDNKSTSFALPSDLLWAVKAKAVERRESTSKYVERVLRESLQQ